jgi:hypothetical protein
MLVNKVSRNDACPCGSGKKYKRCHGANDPSLHSSFEEQSEHVLYAPTPNMLMNRVKREALLIATGFDDLCSEHVAELEGIYGPTSVLLFVGSKNAVHHQDRIRQVLFTVLTNALKSFTAAFSLLRTGWRLQPYQCIRNCMEALSVTLHLFTHPEDLGKFERDKLDSTKTFNSAKQLMPQFEKVYGALSNDFTHVGRPFRFVQKGVPYSQNESDLWHCLGVLMSTLWLTYQVTELVFLDSSEKPLFWKQTDENQYRLELNLEARQWQSKLFSRYKEFMPGAKAE